MNKIMILANFKAHYEGNFICSILYLSNELKKNNYKTIFVFPEETKSKDWHKKLEAAGKTYYISNTRKNRFRQILHIYRIEKCQIVYSHFGYDNEISMLSWIYPKAKFFKHSHTDMNNKLSCFLKMEQFIKRKLFMHRIQTIVVSKHLNQSKKDYYIPNGLVLERFDEAKSLKKSEIRNELGLSFNDFFVLMFAWNLNVKGADIACHALEKILNYITNVKLGIVYNGNESQEAVKRNMEQFEISKSTMEHIIFLKQTNNVEKYYTAADIFLSSSRSEGFPYSILEALYLEKTIVYSDIPGCRWCSEFLNAYPFRNGDSYNCAKVLLQILKNNKNDSLENKILLESKKEIEKNYGIDVWTKRVIQILLR